MFDSDISLFFLFLVLFAGWSMAVTGFGSLVMNWFPRLIPANSYRNWFQGIFGLIIIGSLATIINFFFPISPAISVLFLVFGILLFFVNFHKRRPSALIFLFFACLGGDIGFNLISYGAPVPDTGLYHLTVIRWIMENATPFGLANLHTRFGFNSIWFPLSAVIDQTSVLFNRPVFFLNSILLILYSTLIIDTLSGIARGPCEPGKNLHTLFCSLKDIPVSRWFILLTVLPAVLISVKLKNFVFSPSPDFPVFLLTLVFFAFLIEYIENNVSFRDIRTFLLVILVFFICTIKISGIILAPMVLVVIFYQYLHTLTETSSPLSPIRAINCLFSEIRSIPIHFLLFIIFLIVPYGLRGFILSGNPLFPAAFGSYLQFPWSVPAEQAIRISNEVTAWARLPTEQYMSSLGNFSWFHDWMIRFVSTLFPLIIGTILAALISGGILLYASRRRLIQIHSPSMVSVWYPILMVFLGLLVWFCMSPDFRFALGYFAALPIILITSPFLVLKRPFPSVLVFFICITLLGAFLGSGLLIATDNAHQIREWNRTLPSFSDVPYTIQVTNNGEPVYVPCDNGLVWNMPLPNTPYFNKDLTIIRDNQTRAFLMFLVPKRIE
jgi:hypothetical protein